MVMVDPLRLTSHHLRKSIHDFQLADRRL